MSISKFKVSFWSVKLYQVFVIFNDLRHGQRTTSAINPVAKCQFLISIKKL